MPKQDAAFQELFRNRSATEVAPIPLMATALQFILGVMFASLALASTAFCLLALLHALLGLDPFGIKVAFADVPAGMKGVVGLLAGLAFTLLFFGTMAHRSLSRVRSRLFARLYVRSGRPLHVVEGEPAFDEGSERGFIGLEIGNFYFSFDDCWLNLGFDELNKIRTSGGAKWRVWYIPTGLCTWKNPATGKTVRHGGIFVRAEARSSSPNR
jgi:hypothetical protein